MRRVEVKPEIEKLPPSPVPRSRMTMVCSPDLMHQTGSRAAGHQCGVSALVSSLSPLEFLEWADSAWFSKGSFQNPFLLIFQSGSLQKSMIMAGFVNLSSQYFFYYEVESTPDEIGEVLCRGRHKEVVK